MSLALSVASSCKIYMLFVSWVVTKMEQAGAESLLRSAGSNKNSEGQMCLCASVSARDTSWLLDTYQGKSALGYSVCKNEAPLSSLLLQSYLHFSSEMAIK